MFKLYFLSEKKKLIKSINPCERMQLVSCVCICWRYILLLEWVHISCDGNCWPFLQNRLALFYTPGYLLISFNVLNCFLDFQFCLRITTAVSHYTVSAASFTTIWCGEWVKTNVNDKIQVRQVKHYWQIMGKSRIHAWPDLYKRIRRWRNGNKQLD